MFIVTELSLHRDISIIIDWLLVFGVNPNHPHFNCHLYCHECGPRYHRRRRLLVALLVFVVSFTVCGAQTVILLLIEQTEETAEPLDLGFPEDDEDQQQPEGE